MHSSEGGEIIKKTIIKKDQDGTVLTHLEIDDGESQNSIDISKNAKGEYAWRIKVFADENPEDKAKEYRDIAIALAKADKELST